MEEKDNNTTKNDNEIYCASCGKIIKKEAFVCPHCGVKNKLEANKKNKNTAGILALFLGSIGVHKFYLGKNGEAALRIGISIVCFVTAMVSYVSSSASYVANATIALMNATTFDANTIAELSNPASLFSPLFFLICIPGLLNIIDGIRLFSMNDDDFDNMISNTNKGKTKISNFFVDILGIIIIVIIIIVATSNNTNTYSDSDLKKPVTLSNLSLEKAVEMYDGETYISDIKELISKDINATDDDNGYTALHMASGQGYVEVVEALINEGADIEAKDDLVGWPPLKHAIHGEQVETIKMLIEKGADIEVKDNGFTPLMTATVLGKTDAVRVLIILGADVNASSDYGNTVLGSASSEGYTEIVRILKDAGAR